MFMCPYFEHVSLILLFVVAGYFLKFLSGKGKKLCQFKKINPSLLMSESKRK
jgi:hypothetical protein